MFAKHENACYAAAKGGSSDDVQGVFISLWPKSLFSNPALTTLPHRCQGHWRRKALEYQTDQQQSPQQDYSLSMAQANLRAIPLFVFSAAFVIAAYRITWGGGALRLAIITFIEPVAFWPAMIFGIVAHEWLHGIGWTLFGRKPWSVMRFGIHWKTLTPYAHCTVPLDVASYRVGGALPGILLGGLPAVIGVLLGIGWIAIFGAFFLAAAGGDSFSGSFALSHRAHLSRITHRERDVLL